MRKVILMAVGVLGFASVASAQLSPDEATAKLNERRQHPTTQPASNEVSDLRSVIFSLRAENTALREKVAALTVQLKEKQNAKPATAAKVTVDPNAVIHNGMTVTEVETAIGQPIALVSTADGIQTYHTSVDRDVTNGPGAMTISYWDVSLQVENGRVTHSEISAEHKTVRNGGIGSGSGRPIDPRSLRGH
jgi:hypothetical protein